MTDEQGFELEPVPNNGRYEWKLWAITLAVIAFLIGAGILKAYTG